MASPLLRGRAFRPTFLLATGIPLLIIAVAATRLRGPGERFCEDEVKDAFQELRSQALDPQQRRNVYFRTLNMIKQGKCQEHQMNGNLRGSLSIMLRALAVSAGLSYAQRHAYLTVHIRNFPSMLHSPLRMYLNMGDVILDRSSDLVQEIQHPPRAPKSWRARLLDEVEWWRKELSQVFLGHYPALRSHDDDNRTEDALDRETVEEPIPDLK